MAIVDLDLDLLRCFVVVADARNFTSAGHRLGRSQSAVSVRIKKLEDIMGCQVFERNSHDVQLTDSGKALLPRAKSMIEAGERLLAEMRSPTVSGKLRLGFLEYIAPHKIPMILGAIQRRLPDAELSFRVGLSQTLQEAVSTGELDLALALHNPDSDSSMIVATDQLVWVERDGETYACPGSRPDVCLMQSPCLYRQTALDTLISRSIDFREVLTASSVQSVRSAVSSGLGCSVLGVSCLGDGLRIARNMQEIGELPVASLSLHGRDYRKEHLAELLRDTFRDEVMSFGFKR